MAATIRLGLLGTGRIGQIHGRNAAALPGARLVAVAQSGGAAELRAATGAEIRPIEAILEGADIDAVIIGTPTSTHADYVERAARAGKAIFCEKPVDLSTARTIACLEVVERAGVPLMIGFNRRFDPTFADLKRRLDEGAIGAIEIVTILSRDPSPPPPHFVPTSGGLFRDMMIHDLDMARFLLGDDEPVEVHAVGAVLVDPAIGAAGDVDTAAVILKTAKGRICQISNSRRAAYGYDQRIEVHGATGLLNVGNPHPSTIEHADAAGSHGPGLMNFFIDRYAEAFRRELAAFVDAVTSGRAPAPSGRDGLAAQRLADAATLSHQSGAPVRV